MIHYVTDAWWELVFRIDGTIWPAVWKRVLIISLYTYVGWIYCEAHDADLGATSHSILGTTLAFLLVFRVNNAYTRYLEGRRNLTNFFIILKEVVETGSAFLVGGHRQKVSRWRRRNLGGPRVPSPVTVPPLPEADNLDLAASAARCDLIRWAMIVAISLQLHTRVVTGLCSGELTAEIKWLLDWDRYRLRCLTTLDEFSELDIYIRLLTETESVWDEMPMDGFKAHKHSFDDGPPHLRTSFARFLARFGFTLEGDSHPTDMTPLMRLPNVALYRFSEQLGALSNDPHIATKPYGYSDRVLSSLLGRASQLLYELATISQSMVCPLPFPYFHICKLLLFIYFISFPFLIEHELGFYANVAELCFLSVVFLGVDAIATEVENPFGDDPNDLDVYEKISSLENQLMTHLDLIADADCKSNFVHMPMPQNIAAGSHVHIESFLALKEQVETDGTSSSALRSKMKNASSMTFMSMGSGFIVQDSESSEPPDY